jgi:hypothetical protein
MPARIRQDRRRPVTLDDLNALVAAQVGGCAAIPEQHRDADLMYRVTELLPDLQAGSWAHQAFVIGDVRPCESMAARHDGFDVLEPLTCGTACMFAGAA